MWWAMVEFNGLNCWGKEVSRGGAGIFYIEIRGSSWFVATYSAPSSAVSGGKRLLEEGDLAAGTVDIDTRPGWN
jgi:hypothetical protein